MLYLLSNIREGTKTKNFKIKLVYIIIDTPIVLVIDWIYLVMSWFYLNGHVYFVCFFINFSFLKNFVVTHLPSKQLNCNMKFGSETIFKTKVQIVLKVQIFLQIVLSRQ